MPKRSYNQNCSMAIALDLIGERWTLLIVRELLIAPRRFGELLEALPHIGTNLLTDRLKQLSADGVIANISPDRAHPRYALTDVGQELESVVFALIRWGMRFPGKRQESGYRRDEWDLLPLRALFDAQRAPTWRGAYRVLIGQSDLLLRMQDGRLESVPKGKVKPIAVIQISADAAVRLANAELDYRELMASDEIQWSGLRVDVERFFEAFRSRE